MAQKKMFCPMCGQETTVDDSREFFFCPECGNKVSLTTPPCEVHIGKETVNNDILNERLKEVAFYYQLSFEKEEYLKTTGNPTYYLKAQDLLVDLSEQYPTDYRIWWELCKPLDFSCPSSGSDIHNQLQINEDYFNRALDRADLSKKRELIEMHDKYIQTKESAKALAETRRREAEQAEKLALERKLQEEREKREAEERKKKEAEEAELREAEKKRQAELQRQEEERIKQEQYEAELKRQEAEKQAALLAEREASLKMSGGLWQRLKNKDYTEIDNAYFSFATGNNQTIIASFKNASSILYLNIFRIDGNKGGTPYNEQSMAVQIDENGYVIKFDKSPVKVKGFMPPDNVLRVSLNTMGGILINTMPLRIDSDYIKKLAFNAKKPLMSFSKIFS